MQLSEPEYRRSFSAKLMAMGVVTDLGVSDAINTWSATKALATSTTLTPNATNENGR